MSAKTWTLQWNHGGDIQSGSMASLGIYNPQVTFRSLAADELTFTVKRNVFVALGMFYGDQVFLYKNGAVWFSGVISKVTQVGTPKNESIRYVVSNAWWQLSRTLWQTLGQVYNPTSCALSPVNLTKTVLFQDPASGNSITTGQQIINIITYAIEQGISIAAGIEPAFVSVPFEETRDLLLSDAIRRCAQWTPDAVTWFTYTSGAAVFNCEQRASLTALTLDLSQENLVTDFELFERSDLVPAGVVFNYIGSAMCNVQVPPGCTDPSNGVVNNGPSTIVSHSPIQVSTVTQDSFGLTSGPGVLVSSIDLTQLTATVSENPPVGLAAAYYDSLVTPVWDGRITTHEQECSGMLRPGKVLNLSNGFTAWATMDSLIQEVTEFLDSGKTVATLGTPGHLSPQNFAYLIQQTRRRPLVNQGLAATNTAGTGSSAGLNCSAGIKPSAKKLLNDVQANAPGVSTAVGKNTDLDICTLQVCENGTLTGFKVYCPPQ